MKELYFYPGRYQPMGPHHAEVFNTIMSTYSANDSYIVTSDKTDSTLKNGVPISPLNFNDKKEIMVKHGIPRDKIIQVKNPYYATEILFDYGPSEVEAVYFVGEKDMKENPRFKKTEGITREGYKWRIEVAPHVKKDIEGEEMSGTTTRKALQNGNEETFAYIMGWFDQDIYNNIKTKLSAEPSQYKKKKLDNQFINNLKTEAVFSKGWWKQILNENEEKKYYISTSDIQGNGVFANQDFKKHEEIGKLHTIIEKGIKYEYQELGKYYNHSDTPNCVNVLREKSRYLMALRPIKKGEELTADYRLQPDLEQPDHFVNKGFDELYNKEKQQGEQPYGDTTRYRDHWKSNDPGPKTPVEPAYKYKRPNQPFRSMYESRGGESEMHVYDFDETIARVETPIPYIVKSPEGKIIEKGETTSVEFEEVKDKLKDSYDEGITIDWDFKAFASMISKGTLNNEVFQKLLKSIENPNAKVTILTARAVGLPVTQFLKDQGIWAYVVPLGLNKEKGQPVTGEDKANWIEKRIKDITKKVIFIDDAPENRKAIYTLRDKYPNIEFDVETPPEIGINESAVFSKNWWKNILTEGGAAGHMNHPFDDRDLTFAEMKELVSLSLQGNLNIEADVQEKTDGQNLAVTYKKGRVGAARNKATIREPMSIEEVAAKFEGRGDIKDAFVNSMRDLEIALKKLPEESLNNVFQNGRRFLNMEIIYPATKNVITYGPKSFLQFHGVDEFDLETATKKESYGVPKELEGITKDINVRNQETFEIIPPKILTTKEVRDFDKKEPYYLEQINKLQQEFDLEDSDKVMMYHQKWWENNINEEFPNATEEEKNVLVKRWAYFDKSFRLNSKNILDPEMLDRIKEFDKTNFKEQNKKNVYQFEKIFLELGVDVLANIENFLSLNPEESVKELRDDVKRVINQIEKSKDLEVLKKLEYQLKRIEDIGGFDKLVPSEGIVFIYKGKTYKLTGLFAPINQLLGLTKYV